MTDQPGSREYVAAAFKATLEANTDFKTTWMGAGVSVWAYEPFAGIDRRSVLISVVSAVSQGGAVGLKISPSKRGMLTTFRLQLSCYYDDPVKASQLADAVEQAILDALDTLRGTYDINQVRKVLDLRMARQSPTDQEALVNQDYMFKTHRMLST